MSLWPYRWQLWSRIEPAVFFFGKKKNRGGKSDHSFISNECHYQCLVLSSRLRKPNWQFHKIIHQHYSVKDLMNSYASISINSGFGKAFQSHFWSSCKKIQRIPKMPLEKFLEIFRNFWKKMCPPCWKKCKKCNNFTNIFIKHWSSKVRLLSEMWWSPLNQKFYSILGLVNASSISKYKDSFVSLEKKPRAVTDVVLLFAQ